MTNPSDILSPGVLLTSDRLRRALDAARGEVIGGPGIKVNSVGGKTVVSLKAQRIVKRGGQSDITIARITAVNGTINATYDVQSIGSPVITLTGITPINRFFELDPAGSALVDFLAAPESDGDDMGESMAKIIRYEQAGPIVPAGEGSCTQPDGSCTVTTSAACQQSGGTFVSGLRCPVPSGEGACLVGGDCMLTTPEACQQSGGHFIGGSRCPGLVVEITENVKISTCPTPSPSLPPPPVFSQLSGVLN